MRVIKTKVYTIEEHPNKEKCFDWIRTNWHDLNQHSVDEIIDSIKSLSDLIGGTHDYSICQSPSQGEYVVFNDYDRDKLLNLKPDECPLTGVFWDVELINGLIEGNTQNTLDSLHLDTEHLYSDDGLFDLCQANEYEFYENGKIF